MRASVSRYMRFAQHAVKRAVAIFATTLFVGLAHAAGAAAPACVPAHVADADFMICAFDPATADVRIFWKDAAGDAYGGFDRLAADIAARGGKNGTRSMLGHDSGQRDHILWFGSPIGNAQK